MAHLAIMVALGDASIWNILEMRYEVAPGHPRNVGGDEMVGLGECEVGVVADEVIVGTEKAESDGAV